MRQAGFLVHLARPGCRQRLMRLGPRRRRRTTNCRRRPRIGIDTGSSRSSCKDHGAGGQPDGTGHALSPAGGGAGGRLSPVSRRDSRRSHSARMDASAGGAGRTGSVGALRSWHVVGAAVGGDGTAVSARPGESRDLVQAAGEVGLVVEALRLAFPEARDQEPVRHVGDRVEIAGDKRVFSARRRSKHAIEPGDLAPVRSLALRHRSWGGSRPRRVFQEMLRLAGASADGTPICQHHAIARPRLLVALRFPADEPPVLRA